MTISVYGLRRQIARSLVIFLPVPLAAQLRPALPGQQEGLSSAQQVQPEKNGPVANPPQTAPDDPALARSPASDPTQYPGRPHISTEQQQSDGPEPVGTAAAPYEKPLGVAASRPAGAAIAPAKQKRVRSILIRVGLIAGAAAAIGTVVALSKASPSRPN
jgi:hypothetical protein